MGLLIKNGLILDGTGSQGFISDILIEGDKVVQIKQNIDAAGTEIIDASNKVVTPGFIDMHHHGDLSILEINKAEASIMQGVTTLVVGMCGIGLAPANEKVREYYRNFVKNIFGSSDILYDTIQEYMDAIVKKGVSINLAFFIPHGNVRFLVLGSDMRPANEREIEEMKKSVEEGMKAGAFGLTTGLIYPPGSITSTEEIIELCKIVAQYKGIYDSHIRNEGGDVIEIGMMELIKIAREANVQAQISHWKAGSSFAWKLTSDMINLVKEAREHGLKIYADLYPYEESSTSLSYVLLQPWVYDNFKENLTDLEKRKKITNEIFNLISANFLSSAPKVISLVPKVILRKFLLRFFKKSVRIISVTHNHKIEGDFLGRAIKILYPKRKFVDGLLDFVRDEEGGIMVSMRMMSEAKSINFLFKQDFVCVGSDGFLVKDANTHPRSYGTFPKILSKYVREKNIVSLEKAIKKMTSLPATILGLSDRGEIKENKKADIVIFDFEKIEDKSTYKNGRQFPEGIEYVIVNGKIAVKKGIHTGALNGQILKHKSDK